MCLPYRPRGYGPGYVFKDFDDAVTQLLKDEGYPSLVEYAADLTLDDVGHDFDIDSKYVYIDDGAQILEMELR